MMDIGSKNPHAELRTIGIGMYDKAFWNLSSEELTEKSLEKNEGVITDSGALAISTGKFTGRSPQDRYIVLDEITESSVDWGKVNISIYPESFIRLKNKISEYLQDKELFIKDGYACADKDYKLNVRVIGEKPWSAQFAHNMFLRPNAEELQTFVPDWNIICAPGFEAMPGIDGVKNENFVVINFGEKTILIGGTGYTGEIKKGIFSVLNFILPHEHKILSMHCSANIGKDGDTAIFFGLSGTGKTTLSADPNRFLIGDDEHGWSPSGVFNFEGGCYAKCIGLTADKEPEIYAAIKPGAILENIGFKPNTNIPDFDDDSITQNTRVSYPIYYIDNAKEDSKGGIPKNIFFLTCDAFGILPPISKLTSGQAMYHFISGYTAKVAGTEEGVKEPQATFSACFGAPFLPLHPTKYAEMLGKKMKDTNCNVWLINTGWTGGAYGEGERISLKYTRTMITNVLEGKLDNATFIKMEGFNLAVPSHVPGVPSEVLMPMNTWKDKEAYVQKAQHLAQLFNANFSKFKAQASQEILDAAPAVMEMV